MSETQEGEAKRKGPKLKDATKRRGTNIAMSDETKEEIALIQKTIGSKSRSDTIAQVIKKAATVMGLKSS